MLIYLIGFSKGIYWYSQQTEPTDCCDCKDEVDTGAHCSSISGLSDITAANTNAPMRITAV